jgi:hypothetical protein
MSGLGPGAAGLDVGDADVCETGAGEVALGFCAKSPNDKGQP